MMETFKKDTSIILKSFLGTLTPKEKITNSENYWQLIGQKGKIIDDNKNNSGRILVLFEKNLDDFKLENHNPIKNSLWIKKTDLQLNKINTKQK